MQFVVRMAAHPEELTRFPDADKMLDTPLCKSALKAITTHKTDNLGLLASAMSRNGMPGMTPEQLKHDLFGYISNIQSPDDINPDALYAELSKLYSVRHGIPIIEKAMQSAMLRKKSPLQAMQDAESELLQYSGLQDTEIVSTDNWASLFMLDQKERAVRWDAGRFPQMPSFLPVIRQSMPVMEFGVYVLLGDTGVSKTDFMQQIAEELAMKGENVVFGSTEQRWSQMARRTVLRYTDGMTNEQLLTGHATDDALAALKRFEGKGKILFPRMKHPKLKPLIAIAERNNAHLILDLFHDLDLSDFRQPGYTYFDVLAGALDYEGDWAVNTGHVVWNSIQMKNESRMAVRTMGRAINGSDANGGSAYESKAAWLGAMNFPRLTKRWEVPNPNGLKVVLDRNSISMLGFVEGFKSRESKGGVRQPVWADRAHRRLIPYPLDMVDVINEYINSIYADIKESNKGR